MPMSTVASIDVEEALRMRELARDANSPYPGLTCPECGGRIRPHAAGGHTAAHYEHDDREMTYGRSDHRY